MLRWVKLYGTTDASGDAAITAGSPSRGLLHSVEWIDGTFDDGVDAVLTVVRDDNAADTTLLTLTDANDDDIYYPRCLVHDEAGAALTGTQGGDRGQMVINGYLKLVVSSGGNAKTGGAIVYYEA
jgi:hypothetical protein